MSAKVRSNHAWSNLPQPASWPNSFHGTLTPARKPSGNAAYGWPFGAVATVVVVLSAPAGSRTVDVLVERSDSSELQAPSPRAAQAKVAAAAVRKGTPRRCVGRFMTGLQAVGG